MVLGVDEENRISILAVEPGSKENTELWEATFSELRSRGLDMNTVTVGIMDGLPGLEKTFQETFPNAVTARCWVHWLKNAVAKTSERFRAAFKKLAHKVMYASSENGAKIAFQELKAVMSGDAERAVKCIEKNLESLLVHYRFNKSL